MCPVICACYCPRYAYTKQSSTGINQPPPTVPCPSSIVPRTQSAGTWELSRPYPYPYTPPPGFVLFHSFLRCAVIHILPWHAWQISPCHGWVDSIRDRYPFRAPGQIQDERNQARVRLPRYEKTKQKKTRPCELALLVSTDRSTRVAPFLMNLSSSLKGPLDNMASAPSLQALIISEGTTRQCGERLACWIPYHLASDHSTM